MEVKGSYLVHFTAALKIRYTIYLRKSRVFVSSAMAETLTQRRGSPSSLRAGFVEFALVAQQQNENNAKRIRAIIALT